MSVEAPQASASSPRSELVLPHATLKPNYNVQRIFSQDSAEKQELVCSVCILHLPNTESTTYPSCIGMAIECNKAVIGCIWVLLMRCRGIPLCRPLTNWLALQSPMVDRDTYLSRRYQLLSWRRHHNSKPSVSLWLEEPSTLL